MGMRRLVLGVVVGAMLGGGAMVMTGARGAGGEQGQKDWGWQQYSGKTVAISVAENHVVYGKLVRAAPIGTDVYLVIDQTGSPSGMKGEVAVNTRMIKTVAGL